MDLLKDASQGNLIAVRDALENGADINAKNNAGGTALIYAIFNGHTETANLLIDNGADLKPEDVFGKTALINATDKGFIEIVKILIEKGADINTRNKSGETALMYASTKGYTDIANLLIENGADVNIKNNRGGTALMLASGWGHTETVNLLMEKGADVNARDNFNFSVLMYATKARHAETARLILEKGPGVNLDTETEKLLTSNINSELDSAGKNIYGWFIEHNGQRVQFSITTGDGVQIGDIATINTTDSGKVRNDGFVRIHMVKGEIGSPSGLEIPMLDNSLGIHIESHKVSPRELGWKDITPGHYGGFRNYLVRLV